MEKKKLTIKEAVKHEAVHTFEGADEKAKAHKELSSIVKKNGAVESQLKKSGRPLKGKTKATNKIYFVVDDEQYEYLKSMIDYDKKLTSPSSVAKMLFVKDYDTHRKE